MRAAVATSEGGGFQRDKWRARLGPLLDAWDRLVSADQSLGGSGSGADGAVAAGGDADPLQAFVAMETALASRIVKVGGRARQGGRVARAASLPFPPLLAPQRVASDMAALKGVVLGSGLLSPAILAIGADLLADAVPAKWAAEWDSGPEAPLAWVTGVVTRRAALLRWAAAAAGAGGDSKALLASGPSRIQVRRGCVEAACCGAEQHAPVYLLSLPSSACRTSSGRLPSSTRCASSRRAPCASQGRPWPWTP